MWISKREYNYLTGEVKYWRDKAEQEQQRADRALDNYSVTQGQLPISEIGVSVVKKREAEEEVEFQKQKLQLSELFTEQMSDMDDDLTTNLMPEAQLLLQDNKE